MLELQPSILTRRGEDPGIDWQKACTCFAMLPEKIAVEMWPTPREMSRVQISDNAAKKWRTSIGTALAVGLPWDGDEPVDVYPGDTVIVHPQDGKRIEGFRAGGYYAEHEVRLYGIYVDVNEYGYPREVPWDESILAKVVMGKIQAVGKNVAIKLPKLAEITDEGIYLPDRMRDHADRAIVQSHGCNMRHKFFLNGEFRTLRVGDAIQYERRALKQVGVDEDLSMAIIPEDGIYLVEA